MRVCIVTVYNSENCGSYWQARILKMQLEKSSNSVSLLVRPTKHTSHSKIRLLRNITVQVAKNGLSGARFCIEQWKAFEKAQKAFPVVNKSSDIDCFILGSDTIWNIDSPYFLKNYDLFCGKSFSNKYVISYAASAGNTPPEKFKSLGDNPFAAINALSVRDRHTANIVEEYTGCRPPIVCDPTLLLRAEDYPRTRNPIPWDRYLLIYYFGNIPDLLKMNIISYAKEHNLKIISMGVIRKWTDKSIPFLPMEFIDCFADAACVVTNTFHGTIFSLIFQKQFVAFALDKNKVTELLSMVGAEENNIGLSDAGKLSDLLDRKLLYAKIESNISLMREKSIIFLNNAIDATREER